MATPSRYKKNVNFTPPVKNIQYPFEMQSGAAEAMKDQITDKSTMLPKGVLHIDLDRAFKDWITKDCKLVYEGAVISVHMMSIQKWNEFAQTWEFTDQNQNVKIPFISVVRQPDTKPGTHPNLIHNIPGHPTFTYAEIPVFDGNRKGLDVYKIPQPTPVDITYEVRLFTYRQKELNAFNLIMMKAFNAAQAYCYANGNPIPMQLEDTSDESELEDLEAKRFYTQLYTIQMQGFLLDPEDFQHVPTINRVFAIMENKKK